MGVGVWVCVGVCVCVCGCVGVRKREEEGCAAAAPARRSFFYWFVGLGARSIARAAHTQHIAHHRPQHSTQHTAHSTQHTAPPLTGRLGDGAHLAEHLGPEAAGGAEHRPAAVDDLAVLQPARLDKAAAVGRVEQAERVKAKVAGQPLV